MNQAQTELAVQICTNIITAFPKKSLEQFLDMIEYPGFQAGIAPKIIIAVAHQVYQERAGN